MTGRTRSVFSDQELVREVRSGSGVALERLMRRYERLVYRIAFGFTGESASAMDVTQETFLKVYTRLEGWRGEGELRNWIARVAAHESMSWKRSRGRRPTTPLDEDVFLHADPSQEDELVERETTDTLRRSLAHLSPRQRLAVVLRYFEGASSREIASTLECSEGTARNILFRSLRKLRSVLAESEETLT
jgi:RNA polymerase sigma-70 factor (ECF subfamily)